MRSLGPWKIPFVCAVTSAGLVFALIMCLHRPQAATTAAAKPPARAKADVPVEISLGDAAGRHWLDASYHANGRDDLRASLVNRCGRLLRVTVTAGLLFESADARSEMVVARDSALNLAPGESRSILLQTVATRTTNPIDLQTFVPSARGIAALARLLDGVRAHPEVSRDAVQTATLLITENAPLSVFAKFSLLSGEAPKGVNAEAFRVNTVDILGALSLLKDAGYPRGTLAVAQEPQLEVESMIDPLAHASAVRYYGIANEWAYWRDELTNGDASTRHYALFGIGRYYPDVALQMLPDWARQTQLSPIFRQSALAALAETRRPEAISVLEQLANELGPETELGVCARRSIAYLENQRMGVPEVTAATGVGFKLTEVEPR